MEPINYVPQQGGFATGYNQMSGVFQNQLANMAAVQNMQKQQLAQQQAAKQQEAMGVLAKKISDGTIKASDYEAATIAVPGLREHFKQAWDMHTDEEKKASLNEMTQVYSSLSAGRPDLAKKVLEDRVAALKNSGAPEDQIQAVQTMLKNVDASPEFVQLNTGMMLGAIGAKDAFSGTEEKRKQEMQPGELKKQGADLGLTNAQTNKALVEAEKLGLENKKLMLELEAMKKGGGVVEPEKRFEYEQKLRNEYNAQTGDFQSVNSAYQRILQVEDTPAGDIALIFNYMKMLDPGSVVREGEFATAQNAGGVPDRILNAYNNALRGTRLNKEQRIMFSNQAKSLYKGAEVREKQVRKGLERVVKNYGLNESNVFYSEGQVPTPEKQSEAVPMSKVDQIPGQQTVKFLGFE